jgi:hypothetical protein
MARHWRRAVVAALAAAIGAACWVSAHAQASKAPAAKAKRQDPGAGKKEPAAKATEQDSAAKAKRQDPVEAQRAIEAASKLLRAGKADQAVQSLSATLAGGNLPPGVMAKALYVRGLAYREQKKPAQALSDLTSALWLRGGLGEEERADAQKRRIEVYADAGLTDTGQVLTAATGGAPAKTSTSNWLGNVFGSPQPAAAAPPPKAPTAATERIETATVPKSPGGGWASKTEVQAERVASTAPAQAKRPGPAPPAAKPEPASVQAVGRFQVQLTPVRTKAEAQALAAKAKREHSGVLGEPAIEQTVLGNMGSFYRVRFGPFANAQQTQAVCAKLKGSGLDCVPIGD